MLSSITAASSAACFAVWPDCSWPPTGAPGVSACPGRLGLNTAASKPAAATCNTPMIFIIHPLINALLLRVGLSWDDADGARHPIVPHYKLSQQCTGCGIGRPFEPIL